MTNSEKLLSFKRQYVTVHTFTETYETAIEEGNIQEADIDNAIKNIDEMVAMLPLSFPDKINDVSEPVLLINLNDPEDEPKETEKKVRRNITYILPEDTATLRESTVLSTLEDWKFRIINFFLEKTPEENTKQKYKPLMIAQGEKCLAFYPDKYRLYPWQIEKVVLYANQVGWYTFQETQDPAKLEQALTLLEQGFYHSNWYDRKYIKDTYVRILLKMGRGEKAYPVVAEAFERDANYADFMDLKNDAQFLQWKEEEAARKQAEEDRKKQALEKLKKTISEEQEKIKDQFINPGHPLVQQHAAMLNTLKQRMLAYRMLVLHEADADEVEDLKSDFKCYPLTPQELEAWEEKHGLKLPDEYKVYLMEIGSEGQFYFYMGGVLNPLDIVDEIIEPMKRPFPITSDKIHDVDNFYKVKAWVYPDDKEWIAEGVFPKGTDMKALFGLPPKAEITDGCMMLGNSAGQNELFLIMNGEFEGEIWSDRLQYGAEVRGCFGPATTKRMKFLEYIANSLGKKRRAGDEDEGDWM